jgi:tetratricopeptide (TPR) repeat protein
MARLVRIISFLFILSAGLFADARLHLYEKGNQAYTDGQFEEALTAYQEILNMGYANGPLYYNIGNCYYKLGEIGKSILFYERARKRMPANDDLKANLAIARLSVVDQIEPSSDFILLQAVHAFLYLIPRPLQLTLTLCAYVLWMAVLIGYLLSRSAFWNYISRRLIWIFGILFLILALSFTGRLIDERRTAEAVILADKVDVMSAPAAGGSETLFSLHEGTKVRCDRSTDEWVEIILPDRKVGWVKRNVLEKI